MRRALTPIAVIGTVVTAALIGACTQVSSDPTAVVALQFDSLPYPAIVAGDTLRDETGAAVPLRATALNSDGNPIPSAEISYLVLDSGVTVSAAGFAVSTNATDTAVRVIAQTGNLQSRPLKLLVTPRPDSIAANGTVDTLLYLQLDGPANTSSPVVVKVFSNATTPPAAVRGWIVRFSVEHNGIPFAPTDTVAWLLDDANRRSVEDTTDNSGLASRRLRLNSYAVTHAVNTEDSVTVIATAVARGAPLAGAPVRVVVQFKPKPGGAIRRAAR